MVALPVSPDRISKHRERALIWPPLKIGQPGARGETRENTFASFNSALREGAEGVALDVLISSDSVPVVICDPISGRRSSDTGRTHKHLANTLLRIEAGSGSRRQLPSRGGPQPTRARVASLSEVLRWVRDQKCMAFVTIRNPTPGAEAKALEEINRGKVRQFTRVIANSLPELRRIRQLDAKVHLGLRFSGRPPSIRPVKALGGEVLLPHWTAASPIFIRRAHRASILVIPWTVDSPRQMRRTILEGVDGIITNYPAKLAATVARLQKALCAGAA